MGVVEINKSTIAYVVIGAAVALSVAAYFIDSVEIHASVEIAKEVASSPWPNQRSPSPSDPSPGTKQLGGGNQSAQIVQSPNRVIASQEDFGQAILRAINGGSPEDAGKAALYISACQSANQLRDDIERQRGRTNIPNDRIGSLAAGAEDLIRQCQTVTEDMKQHRKQLAEVALLGGVKGIATSYAQIVNYAPEAAMRGPLRTSLQADAASGDSAAIFGLALHGYDLGLSRVEASAYVYLAKATSKNAYQTEMLTIATDRKDFLQLTDKEKLEAEVLKKRMLSEMPKKPGQSALDGTSSVQAANG